MRVPDAREVLEPMSAFEVKLSLTRVERVHVGSESDPFSPSVWHNDCSSGVRHRQQSQERIISKVRHAAAMTSSSSAWRQRARSLAPNAVHIGRTFFP